MLGHHEIHTNGGPLDGVSDKAPHISMVYVNDFVI